MKPVAVCALALSCVLTARVAPGAELLQGTIQPPGSASIAFSLSGESREDVVGGIIRLGERSFEIARISRMGLIGAARAVAGAGGQPGFSEFVVFSSSFSMQTALGQPWVAARAYVGCDTAYNSFLAVYRVSDAEALRTLGPIPYATIAEDLSLSDESTVFCFMSTPAF